jgi:hypothetical protein
MDIKPLIGRKVHIRDLDNDLYGPNGCWAVIRDVDLNIESLLLAFENSLNVGNQRYLFAVASPRHESVGLDVLVSGGVIGCGVTLIPSDRFDSKNPFDVSWWRGGPATTSAITLQESS